MTPTTPSWTIVDADFVQERQVPQPCVIGVVGVIGVIGV
jgi:hypothetical protein